MQTMGEVYPFSPILEECILPDKYEYEREEYLREQARRRRQQAAQRESTAGQRSEYRQGGRPPQQNAYSGTSSRSAYSGTNGTHRSSSSEIYTRKKTSGNESNYKISQRKRKKKKKYRVKPAFYIAIAVLLLLLLALVALVILSRKNVNTGSSEDGTTKQEGIASIFATPSPSPSPTPEPTPEPTPTPKFDIPHAVPVSNPENWGYVSEVEVNGQTVPNYTRTDAIHFGTGEEYTETEGVLTFRGNNYRNAPSYGTATVIDKKLTIEWEVDTGEIMRGTSSGYKGEWTGSLWTGQPLIVKWPESTKRIMNMYDSAKNKADLVEVIYATASGKIYFLDLDTGEATRDPIELNMPFKGAGALDPRGYPLMYLGSGDMYDDYPEMQTRAMIISLIDGKVLYEFGKAYDPFAIRGWHAYDSSALVSAETDTLIYPGENGIVYTIKLNTNYDETAGTISVNPSEVVKYRYNTPRSTTESTFDFNTGLYKYWLGFESSAAVWDEYLYLASNDGFVHCINLNTMEPVWIQDIWDDANGTIVLEEDEANRTAYLYCGPSLHFTQDAEAKGNTPLFKLDAVTGEIIWQHDKTVVTKSGASGGIQATALLGQGSISDTVIIPFARTYNKEKPDTTDLGYTVAINKKTGEEVWSQKTNFTWSSPVAIYADDGTAYILQPDSYGKIYLYNGLTGERYQILDTESKNFESSGAAYGNMFVIGNKDKKIFGVKIS